MRLAGVFRSPASPFRDNATHCHAGGTHPLQRLGNPAKQHEIKRRPADFRQFARAVQSQILRSDGLILVNMHKRNHLSSARVTKNHFDRQPHNFGVGLFDLGFVVRSLPDLIEKQTCQAISLRRNPSLHAVRFCRTASVARHRIR